ncbi:hypothetical protein [Burkholderia sp. MSMB1078WGS]|uniref:hypothetical protein n=1 Tax=Burkholderia sp. MSMB1078WGS TaxID=1637900 RepID=UPI000A987F59|nr:hypothetical protein [Burkholderia sp. MSMB1078WGS]
MTAADIAAGLEEDLDYPEAAERPRLDARGLGGQIGVDCYKTLAPASRCDAAHQFLQT